MCTWLGRFHLPIVRIAWSSRVGLLWKSRPDAKTEDSLFCFSYPIAPALYQLVWSVGILIGRADRLLMRNTWAARPIYGYLCIWSIVIPLFDITGNCASQGLQISNWVNTWRDCDWGPFLFSFFLIWAPQVKCYFRFLCIWFLQSLATHSKKF